MSSLKRSVLLALTSVVMMAGSAMAKDPKPPEVDRLRAFLIYEDSGDLSKNLAKETDAIVAVDGEKGASFQMLLDVVLTGKPESAYAIDNPDTQPYLLVVVNSQTAQMGDPAMVDIGFPLSAIGKTGEITRTLVIDHGCAGFNVDAYVMVGDKRTSELTKSFNITCGD